MCQIRVPAPCPVIFIGDVSLMNVTAYIHWWHVIDEYIVTFVKNEE
jgi:hypothetical protein